MALVSYRYKSARGMGAPDGVAEESPAGCVAQGTSTDGWKELFHHTWERQPLRMVVVALDELHSSSTFPYFLSPSRHFHCGTHSATKVNSYS